MREGENLRFESALEVEKTSRKLSDGLAQIDHRLSHQREISETAFEHLATLMDDCLDDLKQLGLWGTANQLLSSVIWNASAAQLSRGWLQNRARTKPRGYAGDFELLRWIYERQTGDDPLGSLFDRYFQSQAAPQAVRNRMAMIVNWIVARVQHDAASHRNRPLTIAFVGSALGLEMRDACRQVTDGQRQQVRVVLVDVDPDATQFAAERLREVLDERQIICEAANLFRLPERPASVPALTGVDLLFCAGLFDYLNDEAAERMLRALYGRLTNGGRLIVFQFAPHNPTRAYMEWFGNWYLTYRNAEQLQQVVRSANLGGAELQWGAEPLGIDLFADIRRPFGSG